MSTYKTAPELAALGLGKPTNYISNYAPELLQAVPRSLNREDLGLVDSQPFSGWDVWHGYELSWLNAKGKPVVALMRCFVPASTPNIIESKSFKLYLNSFNQTRLPSLEEVVKRLKADLSATAGGSVVVELYQPDDTQAFALSALPGRCIDDLDIEVTQYSLEPRSLKSESANELEQRSREASGDVVSEVLHSHLLKSNCLITNQPDWASIIIEYKGRKISHELLLRYLISFRMHNEFHEQCVERIFIDLMSAFELESLSVQALYTRRGGLDINPYRTNTNQMMPPLYRVNRQ